MSKTATRKRVTFTEENFEIKTSSVPGIGLGLFTKHDIYPGDTIGYYQGKVLTDKQAESDKYIDSLYLLWICKDHWIYGEGKYANYTRYINHSNKPNARLVTSYRWKTARFEAKKKIPAGSEVFFNYGDEYWEALEYTPK